MNQTPPTSAKGSESMTMRLSTTLRKLKNRSRKMIPRVSGTTSFSLSAALSIYSYCPLQTSEYPAGISTLSASTFFASFTYVATSMPLRSMYIQAFSLAFSLLMPGGPFLTLISATCAMGICAPVGVGMSMRFSLLRSSRSSRP